MEDNNTLRRATAKVFFAELGILIQNDEWKPRERELIIGVTSALCDVWSEIRNDSAKALRKMQTSIPVAFGNNLVHSLLDVPPSDVWQSTHGKLLGLSAILNILKTSNESEIINVRNKCMAYLSHQRQPIREICRDILVNLGPAILDNPFLCIMLCDIKRLAQYDITNNKEEYAIALDGMLSLIADLIQLYPTILISHPTVETNSQIPGFADIFTVLNSAMEHNSSIVRQKISSIILSISNCKHSDDEFMRYQHSFLKMIVSRFVLLVENCCVSTGSCIRTGDGKEAEREVDGCEFNKVVGVTSWKSLESYLLIVEEIMNEVVYTSPYPYSLCAYNNNDNVNEGDKSTLTRDSHRDTSIESNNTGDTKARHEIFYHILKVLCRRIGALVTHSSFELRRLISQIIPSFTRSMVLHNPLLIQHLLHSHDSDLNIYAEFNEINYLHILHNKGNIHSSYSAVFDTINLNTAVENDDNDKNINLSLNLIDDSLVSANMSNYSLHVGKYAVMCVFLCEVSRIIQHMGDIMKQEDLNNDNQSSALNSATTNNNWGMNTIRAFGEEQKRIKFHELLVKYSFTLNLDKSTTVLHDIFIKNVQLFYILYNFYLPKLCLLYVNNHFVSSDMIECSVLMNSVYSFLSTTNLLDFGATITCDICRQYDMLLREESNMEDGGSYRYWIYCINMLQLIPYNSKDKENGNGKDINSSNDRYSNAYVSLLMKGLRYGGNIIPTMDTVTTTSISGINSENDNSSSYNIQPYTDILQTMKLIPTLSEPCFYGACNTINIHQNTENNQINENLLQYPIIEPLYESPHDCYIVSKYLCNNIFLPMSTIDCTSLNTSDGLLVVNIVIHWFIACSTDPLWQMGKLPTLRKHMLDYILVVLSIIREKSCSDSDSMSSANVEYLLIVILKSLCEYLHNNISLSHAVSGDSKVLIMLLNIFVIIVDKLKYMKSSFISINNNNVQDAILMLFNSNSNSNSNNSNNNSSSNNSSSNIWKGINTFNIDELSIFEICIIHISHIINMYTNIQQNFANTSTGNIEENESDENCGHQIGEVDNDNSDEFSDWDDEDNDETQISNSPQSPNKVSYSSNSEDFSKSSYIGFLFVKEFVLKFCSNPK
jgi:hypothetical protein